MRFGLLLIPVLFVAIYFQVFFADYAYLDEIHQLWHNRDHSTFYMFLSQGRLLAGLLLDQLFGAISTIEDLKWLRIFSLVGWMCSTLLWAFVWKKWLSLLGLHPYLWPVGVLYFICSISVSVYIGWASCMEIFLAVTAGMLSAHVLFVHLRGPKGAGVPAFLALPLAAVLGLVSLFFYQSAFGIFLLPFLLLYWQQKRPKPGRVVGAGLLFYLVVHLVYFLLFRYTLQAFHIEASSRTQLAFNVWDKLSFFFSGPLPQGFSLNLLFSARSIFSQVFYPLVILVWLVSVFRRTRHLQWGGRILFLVLLVLLLALVYLPLMIAAENFPSYRTLFAFNLAVFLIVADALLHFFSTLKQRQLYAIGLSLYLVGTGFYTFNFQYVNPLKEEYRLVKNFMQQHYRPAVTRVHFTRAEKQLFAPYFRTSVYRDELGVPSTHRDWVPEPLVRQLVLQQTGSRPLAEKVSVFQYEKAPSPLPVLDSTTLVLNMNTLFRNGVGQR